MAQDIRFPPFMGETWIASLAPGFSFPHLTKSRHLVSEPVGGRVHSFSQIIIIMVIIIIHGNAKTINCKDISEIEQSWWICNRRYGKADSKFGSGKRGSFDPRYKIKNLEMGPTCA